MCQTKDYSGPYLAYEILGQEAITSVIDEYVQRWGPKLQERTIDRNADGDVVLPILEQ